LKRSGRCIVVISEGFDVGEFGAQRDRFGHIDYNASETTVSQVLINYLNKKKLSIYGPVWGNVSGLEQRMVSIYASTVDLEEAFQVARHAIEVALHSGTGWMANILRKPGDTYEAYYDKVPLEVVANADRQIPQHWLAKNRYDLTDDFIKYARPLIGEQWVKTPLENGLQRFARFKKVFAEKRCKEYVPETYRQ